MPISEYVKALFCCLGSERGYGKQHEASAHVRRHQEREHPRRPCRPARQTDCRVQRPLHPDRALRAPEGRPRREGMAVHHRTVRRTDVRPGLEVPRRARADGASQHRRGALGSAGPRNRRPAGRRRRCAVPVLLDAAVRAGRSIAVAEPDGLGGAERREHGDDSPHRGGLRRLAAARRRRHRAGNRRLLDLSARRSRGPARQHHGRRRAVGGRAPEPGVCDRRSDRHQSGERHPRGRLRGHWKLFTP